MQLSDRLYSTHIELLPGVPLYVYAVRGDHSSAIIDTGIRPMRDSVLHLCEQASSDTVPLAWVLTTHLHADHIGNHRAVRERFDAKIACGGSATWLEDFDVHYREFCLPELVAEPLGQRDEILGLMDGPTIADVKLQPGSLVRLGGINLEVIPFAGHKLEEIGFLERESGTLILGDLLLALDAPFFHGFDTASGFRESLARLEELIQAGTVQRVLSSHHVPLEADGAIAAVARTRRFLDDVEAATLEAASSVHFEMLWRSVSARLSKEADFRGYAMLRSQVNELEATGRLHVHAGRIERS